MQLIMFKKIKILAFIFFVSAQVFGNTANNAVTNSDSTKIFRFNIFEYFGGTNRVNILPTTPTPLKPLYFVSGFNFSATKSIKIRKSKHKFALRSSMFGKLYAFDPILSRPLHADFCMATYYQLSFKKLKNMAFELEGNHTSNGLTNANLESRSWNRAIFSTIYNKNNLKLKLSGWFPFDIPDNPDIGMQFGYGSLQTTYKHSHNLFDFQLNTNFMNLRGGSVSLKYQKGFPNKTIKLDVLLYHGKGFTLIDYNWVQSTVSVGLSIQLNKDSVINDW